MGPIRGLACLIAVAALFACDDGGGGPVTRSSARSGLGGRVAGVAATPSVQVSEVGEATFRTPSKNIFCALTDSAVRCDIVHKSWTPPPKPSDCELDWGFGLDIDGGAAGVTCAGDTVIGSAEDTLGYGKAYRSGSVRCDSESSGLTCRDERTGRGFTLAAARYDIF